MIGRRTVWAVMVGLGFLNGLVGPTATVVREAGLGAGAEDLFGISAAIWAGMAIGLYRLVLAETGPASLPDLLGAVVLAFALLIPSSTGSWLAVAMVGCAAFAVMSTAPKLRAAMLLCGVTAGAQAWHDAMFPMLSGMLVPVDAAVAGFVTSLFLTDVSWEANWLTVAGRPLLVLDQCSAFYNLALLCLICLLIHAVRTNAPPRGWRGVVGLILPVAVLSVANTARLVAMATAPDYYGFLHGSVGTSLFNGLLLVLCGLICAGLPLGDEHVRPVDSLRIPGVHRVGGVGPQARPIRR